MSLNVSAMVKSIVRDRPLLARTRPDLAKARRKFLRYFKGGFRDATYVEWERAYKETAHELWAQQLAASELRRLLRQRAYAEIAGRAVRIESRTNLLFSFEKMALRDGVREPAGARMFAQALFELLHGKGDERRRFDAWCEALSALPRKQTRVLTWPAATVFPFIAQPDRHFFFKPGVTRRALTACGLELDYRSRPSFETYAALLELVQRVRAGLRDLRPRDMIDLQSFLWVQGSDEYP